MALKHSEIDDNVRSLTFSSELPDTQSAIVSVLAEKREELERHRTRLSEQVLSLEQEVALLDGVIRMFVQPNGSYGATAPNNAYETIQPHLQSLPDFRRGEIGDAALSVLRAARHPLSTQEVGKAICERRSVTLSLEDFHQLCLRVAARLRIAQSRGMVHEVGRSRNRAILWFASPLTDT